MCPPTDSGGLNASFAYYELLCPHTTICVSSDCYICVRILLSVCPHTSTYVERESYWQELYGKANVESVGFYSSYAYYYICVLILLYVCPDTST
jgi:hypothetical protein